MKRIFIKIAICLVTVIIAFTMLPLEANASKKICKDSGCDKEAEIGSSYCSTHKCRKAGCTDKKSSISYYCGSHKCKKMGCTKRGSKNYHGYCSSYHELKGDSSSGDSKSSSTTSSKSGTSNKYSSTTSKKYGSSTTSKKYGSSTSSSKYSSKSKSEDKVEMPDCDDYETYEDFMDDWDGYIPGGLDAEDYWEDW